MNDSGLKKVVQLEQPFPIGVRQSIIPWICDFLTNRRQAVIVDGCRSDWALVNSGVPQGKQLGPIVPYKDK